MSSKVDSEIVEFLRKSKDQMGYLLPVIQDQQGNIISGLHRKHADPSWPESKIEVKDDLHRILLMIHYNVQRAVPAEETSFRINQLAKILESSGVPPDRVCAEICKLVPYSDRWVRDLLPNKFKMVSKARPGFENEFAEALPQKKIDLSLKYLTFPVLPEHSELILRAISQEKALIKTDNPGEALYSICLKYVEAQSK